MPDPATATAPELRASSPSRTACPPTSASPSPPTRTTPKPSSSSLSSAPKTATSPTARSPSTAPAMPARAGRTCARACPKPTPISACCAKPWPPTPSPPPASTSAAHPAPSSPAPTKAKPGSPSPSTAGDQGSGDVGGLGKKEARRLASPRPTSSLWLFWWTRLAENRHSFGNVSIRAHRRSGSGRVPRRPGRETVLPLPVLLASLADE